MSKIVLMLFSFCMFVLLLLSEGNAPPSDKTFRVVQAEPSQWLPNSPGSHRSVVRLPPGCSRTFPEGSQTACRVCRQSDPLHHRSIDPIFHGLIRVTASTCLPKCSGSLYCSF